MRADAEDAAIGEVPAPARAIRGSRGAARARRLLAPVRVGLRRILRRPARVLVVSAGVALATAALVAVPSGSLVMRDREVQKALDGVAPEARSFRADEFGLAFSASPAAERAATRALGLVSARPPVRAVEFRALRFQSHLVALTAVEGASRWLHLQSGRMPHACRAARCEMLEVGSTRLPRQLTAPGLRLVLVGRASLEVPAVLGAFARPSAATLLVSPDPTGLAAVPALSSDLRTASWVVPLRRGDVRAWNVASVLERETRAQSLLERADPAFGLSAPDNAFTSARTLGRVGTRRLLLVAGEIAAVLLGFALLGAVGLRRTLLAEWRRLEERGARRFQLWLFLATETGSAALAGALVGAVVGIGVAAWAAYRADVGFGALLQHGVLRPSTLLLAGATWGVATLALVVCVHPPRTVRAGPVRIADVVAVAALATALVVASRGAADSRALADQRSSSLLVLLFPGLVSLAVALAAVRLLAPLLRVVERVARRRSFAFRLALLSLARASSRTSVAVAFVVVSVGLALLAASYRATLERGIRDEAAYQVPLDYTLAEGTRLVGPLDVASPGRYRSLAPGVEAYPVLRRYGDVPSLGTSFISPLLLGVEPRAIARVHSWRSDFGPQPPAEIARILGREPPVRLAGAALPGGTTGFGLVVDHRGVDVDLTIDVATPSGEIVKVPLRRAESAGAGRGPAVPRTGRVVALELSLTQLAAAQIAHSQSEGALGGARPLGSLTLCPLVAFAGSRRLGVVTSWRGWVGRLGIRRVPGLGTRLRFALAQGQTALFRPREPTDGHPIPLVVSPDVARAAVSGLLTIQNGTQSLTGKVVAIARRFPGTAESDGSFALADESHLQTALDASSPGTGRPLEVWLSVPSAAAGRRLESALRRGPFATLDVASRRGLERELRADPLSRSMEIALGAGALVALALAVCGLWLVALGSIADERGELYDLEAQGATPQELRSQLRLRVATLAALGIAGGVALGLVLSSEVVRLLQVSASGTTPVPSLVRNTGWAASGFALAALTIILVALLEPTVRRAFREPTPSRTGEIE